MGDYRALRDGTMWKVVHRNFATPIKTGMLRPEAVRLAQFMNEKEWDWKTQELRRERKFEHDNRER